jgi:hypothetical protein
MKENVEYFGVDVGLQGLLQYGSSAWGRPMDAKVY